MKNIKAFILTGEWFDSNNKHILRFYASAAGGRPVEIIITNFKPVFFIESSTPQDVIEAAHIRKKVEFTSFDLKPVDAVYFNTQKDLRITQEKFDSLAYRTYEADVDPVKRFLMEKLINVQVEIKGEGENKNGITRFLNPKLSPAEFIPSLTVASIDIETGIKGELYSIGVHLYSSSSESKNVFMIGENDEQIISAAEEKGFNLYLFQDERIMLLYFIEWFIKADPDVIIGWHVVGFDLMFLQEKAFRLNVKFDIGRGSRKISLRNKKGSGYFSTIPGRIVFDGPPILRAAFYSFEDYKLETVAQEVLGTGKIISPEENKVEEIERQFKYDKLKLAEYNINDALLVSQIFKKTGLIELAVKRAQLSGLMLDQLGMMTAAFDHFYLPRIHKEKFAAPNVKDLETTEHAAGGFVMEAMPGIYDDVAVFDFKSLYPTIILTFKIDPLSRILSEQKTIITPAGYKFSGEKYILPHFIEQLIEQRGNAKKKNDKYLSTAIKILMNSFYGVMGSYGCRFYHHSLPSAITGTGKWLLLNTRKYFEDKGYKIIYGDTDSLFVKLKKGEGINAEAAGKNLASEINEYWNERLKKEFGVQSYLELEFEKHYAKFVLTPARGSEAGAKKRYAGLLIEEGIERLEFTGMENIRSDWTKLAKEFQVELYKRIFNNEEIAGWIKETVDNVYAGKYDDKLVYKKRLRKDVDDYIKNIPPQVRAAKMLGSQAGTVYYVITRRGPIPVELPHDDLDYQHYVEKQLKPIADSVLILISSSFDSIINGEQLSFEM